MLPDDREGQLWLSERDALLREIYDLKDALRKTTSRGGGVNMAWVTQEQLDDMYSELMQLRVERDSAVEAIKAATEAQKVTFEEMERKVNESEKSLRSATEEYQKTWFHLEARIQAIRDNQFDLTNKLREEYEAKLRHCKCGGAF